METDEFRRPCCSSCFWVFSCSIDSSKFFFFFGADTGLLTDAVEVDDIILGALGALKEGAYKLKGADELARLTIDLEKLSLIASKPVFFGPLFNVCGCGAVGLT